MTDDNTIDVEDASAPLRLLVELGECTQDEADMAKRDADARYSNSGGCSDFQELAAASYAAWERVKALVRRDLDASEWTDEEALLAAMDLVDYSWGGNFEGLTLDDHAISEALRAATSEHHHCYQAAFRRSTN